MNFADIMSQRIDIINSELKKHLTPKYPEVIYDAMAYSVFAGGKRLRPLLLLGACDAVGGSLEEALPFAAAIEMIHTYTLIHDDLPAMDNDDYRRGKLTCHKRFSEDIAILAGDGLLNLGFETMLNAAVLSKDIKFTRAAAVIGGYCGVKGTIGGQVADLLSEHTKADGKTLLTIHELKTAALIQAALKAGAVIGGGSDRQLKKFEEIGYNMGIAFQIKDDILDVTSTTEVLGKPVGSDDKNEKSTYISIFGMEQAERDYLEYSQKACNMLDEFGEKGAFLREYAKRLIDRIK